MKYLLKFTFLALLFSLLGSCNKEQSLNIQDHTPKEQYDQNIMSMPSMNYDSLFVQTLEAIIIRYELIKTDLNDSLDNHLAAINELTYLEASSYFDSIGVSNATQLIALIETAEDYEEQILSMHDWEYIEVLISNIEGADHEIAGRPFWGVSATDCEMTGDIVGGFSDSPCFQNKRCKKYRFWIHWGGYDNNMMEVPCP